MADPSNNSLNSFQVGEFNAPTNSPHNLSREAKTEFNDFINEIWSYKLNTSKKQSKPDRHDSNPEFSERQESDQKHNAKIVDQATNLIDSDDIFGAVDGPSDEDIDGLLSALKKLPKKVEPEILVARHDDPLQEPVNLPAKLNGPKQEPVNMSAKLGDKQQEHLDKLAGNPHANISENPPAWILEQDPVAIAEAREKLDKSGAVAYKSMRGFFDNALKHLPKAQQEEYMARLDEIKSSDHEDAVGLYIDLVKDLTGGKDSKAFLSKLSSTDLKNLKSMHADMQAYAKDLQVFEDKSYGIEVDSQAVRLVMSDNILNLCGALEHLKSLEKISDPAIIEAKLKEMLGGYYCDSSVCIMLDDEHKELVADLVKESKLYKKLEQLNKARKKALTKLPEAKRREVQNKALEDVKKERKSNKLLDEALNRQAKKLAKSVGTVKETTVIAQAMKLVERDSRAIAINDGEVLGPGRSSIYLREALYDVGILSSADMAKSFSEIADKIFTEDFVFSGELKEIYGDDVLSKNYAEAQLTFIVPDKKEDSVTMLSSSAKVVDATPSSGRSDLSSELIAVAKRLGLDLDSVTVAQLMKALQEEKGLTDIQLFRISGDRNWLMAEISAAVQIPGFFSSAMKTQLLDLVITMGDPQLGVAKVIEQKELEIERKLDI